jgi:hypothetical protein
MSSSFGKRISDRLQSPFVQPGSHLNRFQSDAYLLIQINYNLHRPLLEHIPWPLQALTQFEPIYSSEMPIRNCSLLDDIWSSSKRIRKRT